MRSTRFKRQIVLTRHASQRMIERPVAPVLLFQVIDEGELRYSDVRLWA